MRRIVALLLLGLAACDHEIDDQKPVGSHTDSEAEVQRYIRRAYLDLSGRPPTDADLQAGTARLLAAQNTAAVRDDLVGELIASEDYAALWIEELENSIFGGNTLEDQYAFVCSIIRGQDRACDACTATDSCKCTCNALPQLDTERTDLRKTTADFHADMATSSIERRYARATGYFVLSGTPEGRVAALFDDFLSRAAEADEIENGRGMIFGSIVPGSPAGLMFHRYGSSYDDLVDIVFESEVYRESMVRRTFNRYLAREPSSQELAHFVGTLDVTQPDARGLVRAVLSSREYFDQ